MPRQYMRSFSQATKPNASSEGGFAKVGSPAHPQSKTPYPEPFSC